MAHSFLDGVEGGSAEPDAFNETYEGGDGGDDVVKKRQS